MIEIESSIERSWIKDSFPRSGRKCVNNGCFEICLSDIVYEEHTSLDPSRIAAQVVSRLVFFLGAGTIIIQKQAVKGLTTLAGL